MTPPPQSKKRRWLRRIGWFFLALLIWSGGIVGRILYTGSRDGAVKSDVIIVLGAAVRKGEPSPAFAARIRHGVELWRAGLAPRILFTGGLTHDGAIPESEIARKAATDSGVPVEATLVETQSRDTWENLVEAREVMRREGMRSAIVVSDPDHLLRASFMASDLSIEYTTSPTPYSVFRTWRSRVPFIRDEWWHCQTHRFFLWAGQRKVP